MCVVSGGGGGVSFDWTLEGLSALKAHVCVFVRAFVMHFVVCVL